MKKQQPIVVLHMGGQLASNVARAIRDDNVYSVVLPYTASGGEVSKWRPAGVIFAGKAQDVQYQAQDNLPPDIPVLTIMNEDDFDTIHPFVFDACHAEPCWTTEAFIENAVAEINEQVGPDGRVLCALSGGVDSMVVAAIVHRAIGNRLTCLMVDHGLMRKNEPEEVVRVFENVFSSPLTVIDASDLYFERLKGVADPEKKRKIIGATFIDVFSAEAAKLGKFDFLAQGTIYPDIIESGVAPGDALIKSHHNVGGLPENMAFACVEPLKMLFKDEVRRVGAALGLPESLLRRQPFPGPGLGVRTVGEITREKVEIVRQADAIYREAVAEAGLSGDISQYFAALLPFQTVGIHGGKPSMDYVVALRAVKTVDFVSAAWTPLPGELLAAVSKRITDEIPAVGRVVFDITNKPPSPIEWE